MQKYYTIYRIDKSTNDISNIMDYTNVNDLMDDFKLTNKKSIYNYVVKNLDTLKDFKHLLKDKYFIMIDYDNIY
jgi:hypothetical protein